MKIFEKQGWHLLLLLILILGTRLITSDSLLEGSFLGISTYSWFWISIIIPILHQIYVVILWRAELHYQLLSRWFGEKGFLTWSIGFFILFFARFLVILLLAISNQSSLDIPRWVSWLLGFSCLPPGIYLGYSVVKHFGIKRALGIDHFQPEEYRDAPFVKEGIFKWSSNAMYTFGFLLFWIPGFLLLSKPALISALFSHLYIWVHFCFTEKPDMKFIYHSL